MCKKGRGKQMLLRDERLDYLPNKQLKIIQADDVFSFSIDAILLAKFVYVPIQKGRLIDLCTGNGVIPLALSERTKGQIYGVEIQERLYHMAVRSVEENGLSERLSMIHSDINALPKEMLNESFDVVTCNPPYFESFSKTEQNVNQYLALARHEIACTLEDVIRISSRLVKQKGKVALVHRPERLTDMIELMRKYRLEPKRVQFIHPKLGKEANIVLLEGMKDGQKGLKCLPPVVVYDEDGAYTKEFAEVYYGL